MATLTDDEVKHLRAIAAAFPAARLVVLFGSVARGTPFAWSDADVGIEGLGFWEGLDLGARIAAALGRDAHSVELERASDRLRFEVARDGILLHEGEPDAWARFQASAALVWFDLAPLVAVCAEGARRRLLREAGRG